MTHTIRTILAILLLTLCAPAAAEDAERPSPSMWLQAASVSDIVVPFAPSDEGLRLPVRWGMDVAWLSEQNMRKGINHIGRRNLSLVRSSFQTTQALTGDTALTAQQTEMLRQRCAVADIMGSDIDLVLNEDQEAGIVDYYVTGGKADADHWARLISASVAWIEANTSHKVVAVSPFNEPDYGWGQGSLSDMREIARKIKEEYPRLKNVAVTGGNTLNDDYASEWYNGLKPYVDWGCTHQLAGSFAGYAKFFAEVRDDGLHPYADELHNVGEAMVGAEYGMKTAVWWGFDSRARGEFCDMSNNGRRIAYKELRSQWTAASVYRHDDGRVKAFIGSSERQANTSTFLFVNKERAAYYDGYGPTREFLVEMPGGTGYQTGQTNAERVVDIVWGEDVPSKVLGGTYKIVNKATGTLLTQSADAIDLTKQTAATPATQQWKVAPVDSRIGGDYSFCYITSAGDGRHVDVKNYSCLPGAEVIAYANDTPTSNQQWYPVYAGDGCYYLRNRESALYLTSKSKYAINHVYVVQDTLLNTASRDRQLWRIIDAAGTYDTTPPKKPQGLRAEANTASVTLQWTMGTDSDLDGYMVLRTETGLDDWNTIARGIGGNSFTDNTCRQGHSYTYKIIATDKADNRSVASSTTEATPTGSAAMVARWHFDGSLNDATENMMDAALHGSATYAADHQSGERSLLLNGTDNYVQLPYEVANSEELTVAMWVKWTNSTKQWTRLFDFGTDTDHYMFLTPRCADGVMRLAVKNGGDEQTLDCPSRLPAARWTHVAVTLGGGRAAVFVNGEEVATSTSVNISPSDIAPVLNYIGRSQFNADPLLQGYIDDVRIYNRVLSASDISKAMADQTNGIVHVANGQGSTAEYYDVQGRRVVGKRSGLNIVKRGGAASKVLVK